MRTTVLISELVLLLGVLRWVSLRLPTRTRWLSKLANEYRLAKGPGSGRFDRIIGLSIALHPGFLILDSIHFQYNAFLFGLMVWSLVGAKESKPILCAGAFATLLMFKWVAVAWSPRLQAGWRLGYGVVGIFTYIKHLPGSSTCSGHIASLPAVGIGTKTDVLLSNQSYSTGSTLNISSLTVIGTSTLVPFGLALGPFIYLGQMDQLGRRLFPFTRGLMHAYWAPK
jgi:alpha-1,3-glucosyltransferase